MSFIFSCQTDYGPHITEDMFFFCMRDYEFLFHFFPLELILEELKKHEVLDESSFEIVDSLSSQREVIDRLHYVMYRIGKKENGLQIFYQCLKVTQDRASRHRHAVSYSITEYQGQ